MELTHHNIHTHTRQSDSRRELIKGSSVGLCAHTTSDQTTQLCMYPRHPCHNTHAWGVGGERAGDRGRQGGGTALPLQVPTTLQLSRHIFPIRMLVSRVSHLIPQQLARTTNKGIEEQRVFKQIAFHEDQSLVVVPYRFPPWHPSPPLPSSSVRWKDLIG